MIVMLSVSKLSFVTAVQPCGTSQNLKLFRYVPVTTAATVIAPMVYSYSNCINGVIN